MGKQKTKNIQVTQYTRSQTLFENASGNFVSTKIIDIVEFWILQHNETEFRSNCVPKQSLGTSKARTNKVCPCHPETRI